MGNDFFFKKSGHSYLTDNVKQMSGDKNVYQRKTTSNSNTCPQL